MSVDTEHRENEEESLAGRRDEGRRSRGSPLWAKAPLALVRYPGLLAAVVVGALLLSLVAAAFPLFISRTEGELLHARIADPTIGRHGAGLFYSVTNVLFREKARGGQGLLIDRLDEEFSRIAAEGPGLGSPVRFVHGADVLVTLPGGTEPDSGPVVGSIFSGTDADKQVDVLEGNASNGAMIPDLIADEIGVESGDLFQLNGELTLRVGGIYRALYSQPRSGYWSPWSEQIYPQCPDCPAPPQFILVGPEEAVRLTREVRDPEEPEGVDYGWVAPISDLSLDVDEARDVRAYAARMLEEVTDRRTRLGRLFECCGRAFGSFFFGRRDTEFRSSMPLVLREVDRRTATVEGPLRLLLIAGLGVAAAVVAAAAAFAVAGRRTEAAFLHARGWGPLRFAAKALLEALIPIGLGAAAGLAAASWLIATFGPPAPAAPSARTVSITWAVAAGAAGLIVLGVTSGVSFIRTFEVHSLKRRLAWVPWEILAIVGALLVLRRLNAGGALIEDTRLNIKRPSALLLAFPVLFVAGFATLGARILVEVLRRTGSRGSRGSPVRYLTFHRLTSLPKLTVLLVGAAALCLGIFVDAQTMVGSLRSTVHAKAGVFVGSDVQVLIDYTAPPQDRFPFPITRSSRLKFAGELLPGDVPFDMVSVDPQTIVDAAFWDRSFSDEPLAELVGRLRSDQGPLPALLVHDDAGLAPTAIAIGQIETPLQVVGRATAFPGMSSDDPVLVVDTASLERRLGASGNPLERPDARTEYWIAGDQDEVLAAISELEAFPLGTLTVDEVKDVPFIKATIDTFSMLNVLGLAAAVLVIGVLVVYLQARQRARTVSNVLSMRMGMRDGQARAALVLELAALLLAAFVLGTTTGMIAGRIIAPLLDPLQTIPPSPLFAPPMAAALWTLVGLAVVSVGGGWLVHWRAAAIDLGEVLRVAE